MEQEKHEEMIHMSRNQIPPSYDPYPWLVYHTEQNQFFCPPIISSYLDSNSSKCRRRSIPALKGTYTEVLSSSIDGWLLIYKTSSQLILWNQISGNTITLPPLELNNTVFPSSILLLSPTPPPLLAKGLVLLFNKTEMSIILCKINIYVSEQEQKQASIGWTWSVMHYRERIRQLFPDDYGHLDCPVYHKGELYAICGFHKLVIIKIDVNEEIFIEPTNFRVPHFNSIGYMFKTYLLDSFGDLVKIYILSGGIRKPQILDVEIYKLDLESKDMKSVVSSCCFKDRVIFLGCTYSFSCLANKTINDDDCGGHIFFTRYGDNSLYSFNIEDESLTCTLPCPDLPTHCKSTSWILTNQDHGQYQEDEEEEEEDEDKDEEEEEDDDEEDEEADSESGGNGDDDDDSDVDDDDLVSLSFPVSSYNNAMKLLMSSMVIKSMEHLTLVEEEREEFSHISKLPLDIVVEITRKLGFTDYTNFRMLSKSYQLAAPLIDLKKLKTQLSLPPWTIHLRSNAIFIFVDPILNMKYFMKIPDHLVNAKIRFSQTGWLLMSKKLSSCMFFYNPFTKHTIKLPDTPPGCISSSTFGFLASSTFSHWVCVGLYGLQPERTFIYYTKSGEEEWQEELLENNFKFIPNYNTPVVLYDADGNGSFYFLGESGNLGVFSLNQNQENEVKWEVLENPKAPCNCKSYEFNFLLECGGGLVSVFVGKVGTWVRVFRLNQTQMVWHWEEVNDLGTHMLFISRYSSFSQPATIPSMANKVYFPSFFKDDRVLYFSLDTGKFHFLELGMGMGMASSSHSQGASYAFDSLFGDRIKGPLNLGWILPRIS